ncbi:ArsR/SmtB family transcription factor [Thermomonospora echinospora]|nr:winged helix-turn-helix domain-containing protein [Thermomonospora echinospora]
MTAVPERDIAPLAALLADRGRAAMLTALLDGRALPAGELARTAGVTAQTASGHLARLLEGGLVTAVRQGRHRYYRLAGPEVAQVIEALGRLGPPVEVRSLRQSRQARALRDARTCYDHLAGRLGVALFEALADRGLIEPEDDREHRLTPKGREVLVGLCVEVPEGGRRFAVACLDWTERRPHLGGALGAALTARLVELGWLERGRERRAMKITPSGRRGLLDTFGCLPPET